MCYRVDCKTCGKYSWGGCGKHLATLYASIDEGKHCMCRSWPGVAITSQQAAKPAASNQLNPPKAMGKPQILEAGSDAGVQQLF